jgi:hypothetical protein
MRVLVSRASNAQVAPYTPIPRSIRNPPTTVPRTRSAFATLDRGTER